MINTTSTEERLQGAREYVEAGLSLVPIGENSKWPPWKWKTYQERKPTDDELVTWTKKYPGLGIVGGKVSGNHNGDGEAKDALEILDLESIAPLDEFRKLIEKVAPSLLNRLPRVETPTGGRHIYYRCEAVEGNQKLAERAEEVTADDLPRTDDGTIDGEAIKKLGFRLIEGKSQ